MSNATNSTDTTSAPTSGDAAPMFPYIFISVAVVVILQRLNVSVIASLLSGLKVYLLPMQDQPAASATAAKTNELAQLSRKQQKRLEKSKQVQLGAADSIMMYITDANYIKGLLYFNLFDGVALFLLFYFLNWGLSVVAHFNSIPPNPALEIFAACILGTAAYAVAEVELMGEWTLSSEKVLIWMAGSVCTVMSGLLLLLGPKFVLDFRIEAGTRQLNANMLAAIKSAVQARPGLRHLVPEEGGQWVDPVSVTASLAVVAGVVAGLSLGACTRWAKLYLLANHPPHWSLQHFNTGIAMRAALGAALLAPCATVILWVLPLTDVLALDTTTLAWLRPASAAVSGVLHLLVLRKLVQTFLTTAIVEWWGITHRGTVMDAALGHRMRVRNQFLNQYVTGKVVLQLLAPATLLLLCGTIHLYSLLKAAPAGSAAVAAAESAAADGASFVQTWAGFLSWWTSLWWFLVTSATVAMHRMGFAELTSS